MRREPEFYIVDIFIAIFQIGEYSKNFRSAEELRWSMLEWDATLRQLEIIGEATKHLISMNILGNRRYRKIVDFRNIISHGYFGIDENDVWYVVKEKLEEFKNDLNSLVESANIDLSEAISSAKIENSKNSKICNYLSEFY